MHLDADDDDEKPIQGDVVEKKSKSNVVEKSDADLDREELERIRQRFNAKKMAIPEKKKATKLDMDDDEEEEEESSAKPYAQRLLTENVFYVDYSSTETVKEEIERLKRELKRSKKGSSSTKSTNDIDNDDSEGTLTTLSQTFSRCLLLCNSPSCHGSGGC